LEVVRMRFQTWQEFFWRSEVGEEMSLYPRGEG
jgi:hypothetical protein